MLVLVTAPKKVLQEAVEQVMKFSNPMEAAEALVKAGRLFKGGQADGKSQQTID